MKDYPKKWGAVTAPRLVLRWWQAYGDCLSEETGIISIVKNGIVKKKYADATDIKEALSDYYWSDLTAEAVI